MAATLRPLDLSPILMPGTDVLVNNLVGMTPLDYAFNPDIRHLLESYVAKEKKSEQ